MSRTPGRAQVSKFATLLAVERFIEQTELIRNFPKPRINSLSACQAGADQSTITNHNTPNLV